MCCKFNREIEFYSTGHNFFNFCKLTGQSIVLAIEISNPQASNKHKYIYVVSRLVQQCFSTGRRPWCTHGSPFENIENKIRGLF
jgi:hypothetical protein